MRSYHKPGQERSNDAPPTNPFGFQGFKNTGIKKNLVQKDRTRAQSTPTRAKSSPYLTNRKKSFDAKMKKPIKPMKTSDGRKVGYGDQKGSLASFMNKELGVKATGKTGLRKTVFNSKEDEELHSNKRKPMTMAQYQSSSAGRQQMNAAKSLGSIFMAGAKDKVTGKILLPSSLKKKKGAKS